MPLTAFQKDVLQVIAANRSAESHFAGGLVLHAADDSARYSHDFDIFLDIVELHKTYPLPAIVWAACGKDEGFSPRLLLEMMRRFARIDPAKITKIQAREIDQIALKIAWTEMSIYAEQEITRLADTKPDMPIGVAFVDKAGKPGWIGDDPTLTIHRPCIRGCLPVVHLGDEE